ncbi:MAG: hypothetical protein WA584_03575 [Pyrinomonadaceae bacterium]
MKNILLFLIFTALSFSVFGQKKDAPNFDIADFNKKAETAEWLVEYDNVAWKTSDVVMTQDKKELERLGKEWFSFQDKNNLWHAVYGKYENDKYDMVFHFTMDGAGKITRISDKIDADFLNAHARALATAIKEMTLKVGNDTPKFNQYIRQNADKTFSVWILPAFQTNGVAAYGREFIYTIDRTGGKIIKDDSYFQGKILGFKVDKPREIWLDYRKTDKPTLGAIFFVWYYKQYFTNIYIDNAKTTSTVFKNGDTDYIWVHVEKKEEIKPNEK